jgi:uncharacterized protein YprB with RNaseH-like and TPR domain
MLIPRSFCHIPGIGPKAELKLWEKGIHDWDRLHTEAPALFKGDKPGLVRNCLDASLKAWEKRDLHYFYRSMPREQLWRILPGFADQVAYLDIETTGMGHPPACHSTTITFYFKGEVLQEYDHRRKLALIRRILDESPIVCTFFGESFDVPFLEREYGIRFDKAHLDLCHWLKRLGYRGGLKKVQKMFADIPERASMDIDGFDAIRLWRMHERGIPGALETLLTYNAEDTVVLAPLLVKAFNMEVDRHPHLGTTRLPMCELPELTTRVHREVYDLLRGRA